MKNVSYLWDLIKVKNLFSKIKKLYNLTKLKDYFKISIIKFLFNFSKSVKILRNMINNIHLK